MRAIALFAMAVLSMSCGSSGARDGGAADAGAPADAGTISDAGSVADGGCSAGACATSGCRDITGAYSICAGCPGYGPYGPFNAQVTHACGCRLQICVPDGDGGTQCDTGCISGSDQVTTPVNLLGYSYTCTGQWNTGSVNFTCPTDLFGTCTATWRTGHDVPCP